MDPAPPSEDHVALRAKMGARIARGIAWTSAGTIAANALRVAVLLALGRLLAPGDFGLVAKANTVLVFVKVIGDLGLGGAIVQHKAPTTSHVRTAFTVAIGLGVAAAALVFAGAGAIADAYDSPRLAPILRVTTAMIVLRGLSSVALQLARRELDFRTTTLADLAGYTAGALSSIALAVAGTGAWSLVWGYMIETVIATAIVVRKHPPPGLGVDRGALRELMRFGAGDTIAQITNMIATQGDYVVVGRTLGEAPLGFYTRAYELVRFPANTFNTLVGSVLFSGLSRLQDDPVGLGKSFRRVLFATSIVLMPASAVLIVLAPETLAIALGDQWGAAVVPFQIMAIGMLVRTNYKLGWIVARARGDMYLVATTQVLYGLAVVVGAIVSSRWGIAGVAVTTTFAIFLAFFLLTALAMRHTDLRIAEVLACHAWPALATAAAGAVAWGLALVTRPYLPAGGVLAACSAGGAAACVAVWVAGARRRGEDWVWALEVLGKVRAKLRKKAIPGRA
jgi:O-antigen/teichoic acid export membrane protein